MMKQLSKSKLRLALEGGDPIVPKGYIMHARWPRISEEEIQGVLNVLRSGELTEMSGRNRIHLFETDFSIWLNTRYALTTNSGTAALHCGLAGLGIEPGDEVVVPALSYIACAAAVIHQQAIPVLADVDPFTYNITRASLERCITKKTKAIMVVHLHGLPADMQSISELAAERGISLIEDFSQAVGASYRGKLVGSIGTVGAASLMAGKNLPSAGEAGILVTNDREIRNKAATLKCFGEAIESDGSYRPLHQTFGYNYRANIISLVFASIQLFRIEEFNELRRSCAAQLNEILETIPGFSPPLEIPGARHIYHMYRFRFDPEEAGLSISADQAREALKEIFLSEGLPLVEFQNHPLSGHALLQQKIAYGRGCPWSCQNAENFQYRNEDFPGALDAIRHSLVIGYPAKAPLTNPEVIAHYIECFKKVQHNMRSFERIGAQLHSKAPWEQEARLF